MKIKISRNIRKYLILYIALILILYLVIEVVPKVTDIFESTQILEPGDLVLTNEASGYLVKTEAICTAPEGGPIEYLVKDGAAVRKNQKLVRIDSAGEEESFGQRHGDLLERLKGYDGLSETKRASISGIFSLTMDGSEKELNPARLDSLTHEKVKDLPMHPVDLTQTSVSAGEPIYKVTDDNRWYVVCWVKEDVAEGYSQGQMVNLRLPDGVVRAEVRSVTRDEKQYRIVFSSDRYYKTLASTRQVKMTIEGTEQSGLLVDNECIIEKDGKEGVYVRDKNGEYNFTRVNVLETDGKESVISETKYIDADGETISTVSVYDEVLKNPEKELKKELREQEKKKKQQEDTTNGRYQRQPESGA